jgi:hypothetical protein
MRKCFPFSVALLLLLFITAEPGTSSDSLVKTFRSGTIENDDIEEPLADTVAQYKAFLDISNSLVAMLQRKEYAALYAGFFHPELLKTVTPEKFQAMNNAIVAFCGELNSWKPMQWYFVFMKENNEDMIISVKVVHHRDAVVYYRFTFYPDDPGKIIGFYFQLKSAPSGTDKADTLPKT